MRKPKLWNGLVQHQIEKSEVLEMLHSRASEMTVNQSREIEEVQEKLSKLQKLIDSKEFREAKTKKQLAEAISRSDF